MNIRYTKKELERNFRFLFTYRISVQNIEEGINLNNDYYGLNNKVNIGKKIGSKGNGEKKGVKLGKTGGGCRGRGYQVGDNVIVVCENGKIDVLKR